MGVFDWVRNKLKSDKLKALSAAAQKAQGPSGITLTDAERQSMDTNFFLSSGLDFKGQSQCCFEAKGGGAELGVEVDPAMLASGVFSSHMGAEVRGAVTDKIVIIAQVGPKSIGKYQVPYRFLLNTCRGYAWSGGVSADIFIGVGATAGISFDMEVAGKDFSASAKAEAKVGLTATAALTAAYYYAEDYAPLTYADREQTRNDLRRLLSEGGNKKNYFKDKAADLVGRSSLREGFRGAWSLIAGSDHRSTETIISWLDALLQSRSGALPADRQQARMLKTNLELIKNGTKPVIPSSIRITNYCGEGGVEMLASASAEANACGLVGAKVEASAKACANGKYKPVTVRYQAVYPAVTTSDDNTRFVVMTQDTRILYEKYDLSLSLSASAEIVGSGEDSKPLAKVEGNKDFTHNLNRMTYITTIVYWQSQVPWPTPREDKDLSLSGSGICFGGSYELEDLAIYSKNWELEQELLQPLFILNNTGLNAGDLEATPTDNAIYEEEKTFDSAALLSASAFSGPVESETAYDGSKDPKEEFDTHVDPIFTGSKEGSQMFSRIGQALADYDKQKTWHSYQSAGSKKAQTELKRMVLAENSKLGDTVAWLLGEDKGTLTALDKAAFPDGPLHQVGGAKGLFTQQKSKGDTEGRLYGLLKARYSEALLLDKKEEESFVERGRKYVSAQATLSQQLQASNKEVRDRNTAERIAFEAAEKDRVRNINRDRVNKYTDDERMRVDAENKKIRDKFDTELALIQANNNQKRADFVQMGLDVKKRNDEKIAEIERINSQIEITNSKYKDINRVNKFADNAHRTIDYNRSKALNFEELEQTNEMIIQTNREILARNEIKQKKWAAENKYNSLLAANLHVSVDDLKLFFENDEMKDWMLNVADLMAMGKTVLLESTFSLNNDEIKLVSTMVPTRTKRTGRSDSIGTRQALIELKPDTGENMLEIFEKNETRRKLESIRMRWRIQDMADSSKNLFKLGISVLNQGGNITLKRIDEAGSEGIVDLCTVFFGDLKEVPKESLDYSRDRSNALESAVPPTVLYCL